MILPLYITVLTFFSIVDSGQLCECLLSIPAHLNLKMVTVSWTMGNLGAPSVQLRSKRYFIYLVFFNNRTCRIRCDYRWPGTRFHFKPLNYVQFSSVLQWPYSYDSCDVGTLPNQTFPGMQTPTAAFLNGNPNDGALVRNLVTLILLFVDFYSQSYLPGHRLCT